MSDNRNFRNSIDVVGLKKSIDPVQFYQKEGQEVNTSGGNPWRDAGVCPFHEDREAGSFFIHRGSGAFKCFACDCKGGDIIAFTQKMHDMSFYDAIKKLAREWRVS